MHASASSASTLALSPEQQRRQSSAPGTRPPHAQRNNLTTTPSGSADASQLSSLTLERRQANGGLGPMVSTLTTAPVGQRVGVASASTPMLPTRPSTAGARTPINLCGSGGAFPSPRSSLPIVSAAAGPASSSSSSAPNMFNSYEENQRLRRELHATRQHNRQLQVEITEIKERTPTREPYQEPIHNRLSDRRNSSSGGGGGAPGPAGSERRGRPRSGHHIVEPGAAPVPAIRVPSLASALEDNGLHSKPPPRDNNLAPLPPRPVSAPKRDHGRADVVVPAKALKVLGATEDDIVRSAGSKGGGGGGGGGGAPQPQVALSLTPDSPPLRRDQVGGAALEHHEQQPPTQQQQRQQQWPPPSDAQEADDGEGESDGEGQEEAAAAAGDGASSSPDGRKQSLALNSAGSLAAVGPQGQHLEQQQQQQQQQPPEEKEEEAALGESRHRVASDEPSAAAAAALMPTSSIPPSPPPVPSPPPAPATPELTTPTPPDELISLRKSEREVLGASARARWRAAMGLPELSKPKPQPDYGGKRHLQQLRDGGPPPVPASKTRGTQTLEVPPPPAAPSDPAEEEKARRLYAFTLMQRLCARRLMARDLWRGLNTWLIFWRARRAALDRLATVAKRLLHRDLLAGWHGWVRVWLNAMHQAQRSLLADQIAKLATELRKARFDLGQLDMIRTALEDEVRRLKEELIAAREEVSESAITHDLAGRAADKAADLERRLAEATDLLKVAEAQREAAEAEITRQRKENQGTLEALLAEQHGRFSTQLLEVRTRLRAMQKSEEARLHAFKAGLDDEANHRVHDARVQTMSTLAARRMRHRAVFRAWATWHDWYAEHTFARRQLRWAVNGWNRRGLQLAFEGWVSAIDVQKEEAAAAAKADAERTLVAGATGGLLEQIEALTGELQAVSAERQRLHEELRSESALREEHALVRAGLEELTHRKLAREYRGNLLSNAWAAWFEMWSARVDGFARIRRAVHHIMYGWHVANAFGFWQSLSPLCNDSREEKLQKRVDELEAAVVQRENAHEGRLAAADEAMKDALARQKATLMAEFEAEAQAKAIEYRNNHAEEVTKRIVRRLMNEEISWAWEGWVGLVESRRDADGRLASLRQRCLLSDQFHCFHRWTRNMFVLLRRGLEREVEKRESEVSELQSTHAAEYHRLWSSYEAKVEKQDKEFKSGLESQKEELEMSARKEVADAERRLVENEQEGKIEIMRRLVTRTRTYKALDGCFHHWHEQWEDRTDRRQLRSHMRAHFLYHAKRAAIAKLRRHAGAAKGEAAQSTLEAARSDASHQLQLSLAEVKALQHKQAVVEEDRKVEMATFERLLVEQRERFESEMREFRAGVAADDDTIRKLRDDLGALSSAQAAAEARAKAVEEELRSQRAAFEQQLRDAASEMAKLREASQSEAARLQSELSKQQKRQQEQQQQQQQQQRQQAAPLGDGEEEEEGDGAGGAGTYWDLNLEEGDGAAPVEQQLFEALQRSSARVIDLFNAWDADHNGKVSRPEFHKAMKHLGYRVPAKAINSLFDSWDKDGGGDLRVAELTVILKGERPNRNIDLDEGPDAKPVSEQLADALTRNATKVTDLFRTWDNNGDGIISRKEFHVAMRTLGYEVGKKDIDALFDTWDRGGDGELSIKELQKILNAAGSKRPGSPATTLKKGGQAAKLAVSTKNKGGAGAGSSKPRSPTPTQ